MTIVHDPQGSRLPIKIDSTCNGEFAPLPLDRRCREGNHLAKRQVTVNAKKMGLDRRSFLVSSCGAATTLLAINRVNAQAGNQGGYYQLAETAGVEPELAADALDGREFIFDVQGHYVRPGGHMQKKAGCAGASVALDRDYMACLGADSFIKDVFVDADTDMMVLSFVPSTRDAEPLTIEEADATRRIVDAMDGDHRLLLHGRVNPNQAGDIEDMERLAEQWKVSAWKCYTQWGPDGNGFFLDDDIGHRFIEKARATGIKNIAIHKGIPFGKRSYEHSLCTDIGRVAKQYPDVNFLIYHSGWVPGQAEGPYDAQRGEGVDSLIQTVLDNELGLNSNVYAELGSTWRGLMRDPTSAAHALGKMFKYLGPDNVLWGTDSVWYGSPQDQIQAFRTFQIAADLREQYGYPEITPALRAKVFGLNATRIYAVDVAEAVRRAAHDSLFERRLDERQRPNPHYLTHGPKTRREFLNLLSLNGGSRV